MRPGIAIVGLAALLTVRSVSAAADINLDVSANRSSMYLGESLILTVKVSGMGSPPQPDVSSITNATVRFLGSQSDSRYSIAIVNGRVTRESFSGRVFSYEIRPSSAGRFVAGPVRLSLDGRTLTQPGPVIEVAGVEQQEWAILTISASRDAVLVDEPFEITLSLLLKRLRAPYAEIDPLDPGDPPALNAAFLNGSPIDGLNVPDVDSLVRPRQVGGRSPGYTINDRAAPPDMFDMDSLFGRKRAKHLLEKRVVERGGQSYFEHTIKLSYVPKQEGSYTFGPAEFKGKMIVGADPQGRGIGKTIFAVGPACTVRVVAQTSFAETEGARRLYEERGRAEQERKRVALGRFGRKEDIANAAVYLASDLGNYITGENLIVDGGRWLKYAGE